MHARSVALGGHAARSARYVSSREIDDSAVSSRGLWVKVLVRGSPAWRFAGTARARQDGRQHGFCRCSPSSADATDRLGGDERVGLGREAVELCPGQCVRGQDRLGLREGAVAGRDRHDPGHDVDGAAADPFSDPQPVEEQPQRGRGLSLPREVPRPDLHGPLEREHRLDRSRRGAAPGAVRRARVLVGDRADDQVVEPPAGRRRGEDVRRGSPRIVERAGATRRGVGSLTPAVRGSHTSSASCRLGPEAAAQGASAASGSRSWTRSRSAGPGAAAPRSTAARTARPSTFASAASKARRIPRTSRSVTSVCPDAAASGDEEWPQAAMAATARIRVTRCRLPTRVGSYARTEARGRLGRRHAAPRHLTPVAGRSSRLASGVTGTEVARRCPR